MSEPRPNDEHPTSSSKCVPRALVSLTIGDAKLRVEGPEDLVERTIVSYLPTLQRLMNEKAGELAPPQASTEEPNEAAPLPLGMSLTAEADFPSATEEFNTPMAKLRHWYKEQVVHPDGKRGFVQDHVMLFTYFTTHVAKRHAAATADIRQCFEALDMRVPNIPVMVYNLKAKGQLIPAEQYASYHLTDAGRTFIEDRYSLVRKIH